MRWFAFLLILLAGTEATRGDDAQAAKDATIVETLLRLKTVDVNSNPKLKDAVLRHLELHKGTRKYVDLVDGLNLRGVEQELLQLALADPASTEGVHAGELLLERDQTDLIATKINGDDEEVATKAVALLGYVGSKQAMEILKPLPIDSQRTRPRLGEKYLLQVVEMGKLPADLNFTVANVLHASTDDAIRTEVTKHLTLPVTAGSKPLAPVAELAKRSGDLARGQQLFKTTATCIKCHKVRGEGKEVGPDLSEIGGKLPKEAMFISILDPNAGISHNYETYSAILDSGNVVSGLKVNETDESVTIRSAESIDKVISKAEIEEIVKSSVSLMPADLQKTMSEQDLVDVVEYISTLKK
ncbi:MAG: c-type cytochrome [Planctomycetia bacterium]|nr:c-type cytochrome [Planctomycetia bacterium]